MKLRRGRSLHPGLWLLLCGAGLSGCESEAPPETPSEGEGEGPGEGEGEGAAEGEGEGEGGAECSRPDHLYPGDAWDACTSDDGAWHLAGEDTPSSAARVAAFEVMADLLWRSSAAPGRQAFIDAAAVYGEEGGVGSRVTKRYDSHVDRPDGADCKADEAGATWPDYCVGPGSIEPLVLGALEAGVLGNDPQANARRIEAALAWFYYVSAFKEANTCKDKASDCDSSWAYYGGGRQLDKESLGLGGMIQDAEPGTHAAAFDALLGLRCWRDLDDAEVSEEPELHARALVQLDAALDRGLAAVLLARLGVLAAAEGDARGAHWAFLEVLGPVLDRAARALDAGKADRLEAVWAGGPEAVDTLAAIALLNEVFPCPY